MTKKELVRLIREVVKREIKSAVQNELNEALSSMEAQKNTGRTTLSEVMEQTKAEAKEKEWPTMGNFTSDMRAQFAAMNGMGAQPQTDINNRPVDPSKLDKSLSDVFNRDYSELVKRF